MEETAMKTRVRSAAFLAFISILGTQPAHAQNGGNLTSKIEVERLTPAADGRPPSKSYAAPETVVPGDRIRITLNFTNAGQAPAAGVNLVNPIPPALVFDGTDDVQDFAVSVDGGKVFGPLAQLTVPVAGAAPRAAAAADVTHVRWKWADAVAPGQTRSVAFFGKVK
jgi:uncharacterized repeat protein (TIGR01451 family)